MKEIKYTILYCVNFCDLPVFYYGSRSATEKSYSSYGSGSEIMVTAELEVLIFSKARKFLGSLFLSKMALD